MVFCTCTSIWNTCVWSLLHFFSNSVIVSELYPERQMDRRITVGARKQQSIEELVVFNFVAKVDAWEAERDGSSLNSSGQLQLEMYPYWLN